jgi:uncharacterized membrane protein YbhN (UPF0104 family)
VEIFALSIISLCFFSLSIFLVFRSLEIRTSAAEVVLFVTTILISRAINIVPGNIGITEIVCGHLNRLLGGTIGNGILVSGVLRTISYLINILLGILAAKTLLPKKIIEKYSENGQTDTKIS